MDVAWPSYLRTGNGQPECNSKSRPCSGVWDHVFEVEHIYGRRRAPGGGTRLMLIVTRDKSRLLLGLPSLQLQTSTPCFVLPTLVIPRHLPHLVLAAPCLPPDSGYPSGFSNTVQAVPLETSRSHDYHRSNLHVPLHPNLKALPLPPQSRVLRECKQTQVNILASYFQDNPSTILMYSLADSRVNAQRSGFMGNALTA